jgi:hypothetical protein
MDAMAVSMWRRGNEGHCGTTHDVSRAGWVLFIGTDHSDMG